MSLDWKQNILGWHLKFNYNRYRTKISKETRDDDDKSTRHTNKIN